MINVNHLMKKHITSIQYKSHNDSNVPAYHTMISDHYKKNAYTIMINRHDITVIELHTMREACYIVSVAQHKMMKSQSYNKSKKRNKLIY